MFTLGSRHGGTGQDDQTTPRRLGREGDKRGRKTESSEILSQIGHEFRVVRDWCKCDCSKEDDHV